MVKHTIFALTVGLLIFFLYLLQYTGAFKSVDLRIDQRGPYEVIYKEHTGAYHKIVPVIEDVEKWAKTQNLKCRLSFGEYFDNPQIVEEGRLKSRGGCVIDPLVPEEKKIFETLVLPEGYKKDIIPESKMVVALFTGAPSIGPFKVYPKAEQFIQEGKLKATGNVIEIYEVLEKNSMRTLYFWPLLQ